MDEEGEGEHCSLVVVGKLRVLKTGSPPGVEILLPLLEVGWGPRLRRRPRSRSGIDRESAPFRLAASSSRVSSFPGRFSPFLPPVSPATSVRLQKPPIFPTLRCSGLKSGPSLPLSYPQHSSRDPRTPLGCAGFQNQATR